MWRLGPDGYGSISSWYQWFSCVGASSPVAPEAPRASGRPSAALPPAVPARGFGTLKARSSAQTRCHFASISWGSYLGVIGKRPLERKNLSEERRREPAQRRRACLPELGKKQLLHRGLD